MLASISIVFKDFGCGYHTPLLAEVISGLQNLICVFVLFGSVKAAQNVHICSLQLTWSVLWIPVFSISTTGNYVKTRSLLTLLPYKKRTYYMYMYIPLPKSLKSGCRFMCGGWPTQAFVHSKVLTISLLPIYLYNCNFLQHYIVYLYIAFYNDIILCSLGPIAWLILILSPVYCRR